jgi:hypothetical protein
MNPRKLLDSMLELEAVIILELIEQKNNHPDQAKREEARKALLQAKADITARTAQMEAQLK